MEQLNGNYLIRVTTLEGIIPSTYISGTIFVLPNNKMYYVTYTGKLKPYKPKPPK